MKRLLLSAVMAASIVSPAMAQGVGPGPGQFHPPMHHGLGCMIKDGAFQAKLGEIHDELKITPAQEKAWKTFASKIETDLSPLASTCGKPFGKPDESLPEKLSSMATHGAEMARIQADVATDVLPMYAKLTDEQKGIADHIIDRQMRPHHGPHGGPHEGFGGPREGFEGPPMGEPPPPPPPPGAGDPL